MINILTDDVELLKEACERLAEDCIALRHPYQYEILDKQIASRLRCENLNVEVEE